VVVGAPGHEVHTVGEQRRDLDGDGLTEIVWIDGTSQVYVWTVPGTPGPPRLQWPMFRGDATHMGAFVGAP
jgi:hypothetical protein